MISRSGVDLVTYFVPLLSSQTLNFIGYAYSSDLLANKLRLYLRTNSVWFYKVFMCFFVYVHGVINSKLWKNAEVIDVVTGIKYLGPMSTFSSL